MKISRRGFLATGAAASALSILPARRAIAKNATDKMLDQAAARPVLDVTPFKDPVVIESIELLRKGKEHFVRVRSKDGAEGISVDESMLPP